MEARADLTFKNKHWNPNKRGDYISKVFCQAPENPDKDNWVECEYSELKSGLSRGMMQLHKEVQNVLDNRIGHGCYEWITYFGWM